MRCMCVCVSIRVSPLCLPPSLSPSLFLYVCVCGARLGVRALPLDQSVVWQSRHTRMACRRRGSWDVCFSSHLLCKDGVVCIPVKGCLSVCLPVRVARVAIPFSIHPSVHVCVCLAGWFLWPFIGHSTTGWQSVCVGVGVYVFPIQQVCGSVR
uniref:Uncharacterized protein n=1 Tax=Vitrella brassicaformis TaxID=1169539 RepID=A0A7S1PB25_9ALVE